MIEVALVFDREGRTLHWHLPSGGSAVSIPDSRSLWEVLWTYRHELGGVAHTHPWDGRPVPSHVDLTTWSACERALGARLVWPIVTWTEVASFVWKGPETLDYERQKRPAIQVGDLEELWRKSRKEAP